jgi:hypothetical protein
VRQLPAPNNRHSQGNPPGLPVREQFRARPVLDRILLTINQTTNDKFVGLLRSVKDVFAARRGKLAFS